MEKLPSVELVPVEDRLEPGAIAVDIDDEGAPLGLGVHRRQSALRISRGRWRIVAGRVDDVDKEHAHHQKDPVGVPEQHSLPRFSILRTLI